jgi:hypothetical protein
MKRALLIGPEQVGEMAWFVRAALERAGFEVVSFDDRAYLTRLPSKAGKAVQIAQTKLRTGPLYRRLQGALTRAAGGAHLILTIKGENIAPDTVDRLSRSAPVVNWYSDHPFLEQNFDSIGAYTYFCPKDTWTTHRLEALGYDNVRTLPHAGDPSAMSSGAAERFDIGVMGSHYAYRSLHVRCLAETGFSMQVHGDIVPSLPAHVRQSRSRALGRRYADAMASSRMILNTHTPRDIAGANQRLFDAAAAGRPQLTEDLPDSREIFPEGVIFFHSLTELVEHAAHWRDDGPGRKKLGDIARQQILDRHTYDHRVATILDWLR